MHWRKRQYKSGIGSHESAGFITRVMLKSVIFELILRVDKVIIIALIVKRAFSLRKEDLID